MKPPTIVRPEVLKRQMLILLEAWGMPEDQARETATILQGADLMGIDSHGLALFPLYDEIRRSGKLVIAPAIKVVRNISAIAVIDGGGGFGEAPAARAMKLAIEKARTFGIGAVTVRNSNHYGAAGIYALMAAEQDFIGISTTATFSTAIVPTFGKEPMLGTNPIAFAAPARRNPPFLLDMATSTVAVGKVKLALMAGKKLPDGWVTTKDGGWQSDPATAMIERLLTPLGGDRLHGGHKGYGLATMVEILSTTLSGGSFTPLRPDDAERYNVGHFQLAMNPDLFRDEGGFREDLDTVLDALRATPPIDQSEPVKVAGDPEHATRREREQNGVPVPEVLAAQILGLCKAANAEYLLK